MRYQSGESVVLCGVAWGKLRFSQIDPASFILYTIEADLSTRALRPGADYELDAAGGRLRRAPGSLFGNYEDSAFFGKDPFDHETLNEFGNAPFMVYASYLFDESGQTLSEHLALRRHCELGAVRPTRLLAHIAEGRPLRYVVFGDSISTGCEARPDDSAYFHRFRRLLEAAGAPVELEMAAVCISRWPTCPGFGKRSWRRARRPNPCCTTTSITPPPMGITCTTSHWPRCCNRIKNKPARMSL